MHVSSSCASRLSDHRRSGRWCRTRDMNDRPVNGLLLFRRAHGAGDGSPVVSSILSLERTNRGSYCLSGRRIHLIRRWSPVVGRKRRKKKTDASHVVDFSFNRQRIRLLSHAYICSHRLFDLVFLPLTSLASLHRLPFTTPPRLPISEPASKDMTSLLNLRPGDENLYQAKEERGGHSD